MSSLRRDFSRLYHRPLAGRLALGPAVGLTAAGLYLVLNPAGALSLGGNLAIFAGIVCLVVGIHEFMHLLAARALGIRVLAYGLGFGPRLIERHWAGIAWSLNALPFGGYVKLHGEESDEGPDSFSRAPAWKRITVLLAGPLSNLVLGFVILVFLALFRDVPLEQAPGKALEIIGLILNTTVTAIGSYLPNATSAPLDMPISGLPGMVSVSGQLFAADSTMFIILVAAISISMGIMNLLPIPPMDGGQAAVVAVASVCGNRPRPLRVLRLVQFGGLTFILGFMSLVNGIDLLRMLLGHGVTFGR